MQTEVTKQTGREHAVHKLQQSSSIKWFRNEGFYSDCCKPNKGVLVNVDIGQFVQHQTLTQTQRNQENKKQSRDTVGATFPPNLDEGLENMTLWRMENMTPLPWKWRITLPPVDNGDVEPRP